MERNEESLKSIENDNNNNNHDKKSKREKGKERHEQNIYTCTNHTQARFQCDFPIDMILRFLV